jgi:hypothetical protein
MQRIEADWVKEMCQVRNELFSYASATRIEKINKFIFCMYPQTFAVL